MKKPKKKKNDIIEYGKKSYWCWETQKIPFIQNKKAA
jgi:hypothetical protein